MPSFSYRDVIKKLKKLDFEFLREAPGSHEIWGNLKTGKKFPVPKHNKDLKLGTVKNIAKLAGCKNIHEFQNI